MLSVGRLEGKVDMVLERLDRLAHQQAELGVRTQDLEKEVVRFKTYLKIGTGIATILSAIIVKLLVFTTYVQVSIPQIPKVP